MSTLLARLASFWRRVALMGVVIGFGLDLSGPVAWAQGLVLQPNPTSAAVNQAVTLHVEAWSSGNRPCGETCNAWPVAVVVTLAGSNGYENELVLELSDPWGNPWQALVANPTDVANTNGQDTDYGATGAVLWYECNYYCQYFGHPPEPWWEPLGEVGATVTAVLPNVPASVSVSPASGSGARQVFVFTYSDDAGANKIAQTWQIFHPSGQTSQSCVVGLYAPNYLVLWGDQGWQDQTSATLGSTAVLQNSQCRLHMSNVGVTESGNTLTVSLDVSFKSSYAGSKAITMYGYDVWGRYATPANMGAWTVPVHTLTAGPVTPVNGTGMSATLTGAFASTYGVADIQRTQLILWPASGGFAQACQVAFDRPSQQVGLLDDTGTTETWAAFGSSTVLQNSRCAVAAALVTTAEPSGTTWQVTATLAFTPAFGGTHTLYAVTYDPAWQTSQWQGQGTWTVAPTITSVTPTSGRVGDLVDVVGAGFGATAGTVRINGQTATIANWSDTYIRLAVPNTTSGNLVVTRESLDSAPVAFTVLPGPRITSLVPTWGPAGTEVTVSGHDFGSSGTLTLNGTTITVNPGDWADDTITFVVPSGVQTGAVIVTNGSASNGVPFVVGDEGEEYVLTDAIGSIRMVTGHGGYVLARHDYQPFGIEVLPANGLAHDGFGGKELDSETGAPSSDWAGLNYFGARHFQAAIGRFVTVDSITIDGTRLVDPQQQNLYAYARNNPLKFVDPDGRQNCRADSCVSAPMPPDISQQRTADHDAEQNAAVLGLIQGRMNLNAWLNRPPDVPCSIEIPCLTPAVPEFVNDPVFVAGLLPPTQFVRLLNLLRALRAARSIQTARQLGKAGEIAAGIVKNTQRIPSATGTAAFRVPDYLNHATKTIGVIGEVKNVGALTYTNQLRDFMAYASQNGYTFELVVRPTTKLDSTMRQLVNSGDIVLKFLP